MKMRLSHWQRLPAIVPVLALLLASDPPVPAMDPHWWANQGALVPGASPADYGSLNVGQLKTFAFAAYDELSAALPVAVGVGAQIETLVKSWCELTPSGQIERTASGRPIPKPSSATADYAAVNIGMLKSVAKPFYDRLIDIGYTDHYPWANGSQADYGLANIGQAKTLFSFDVRKDSDTDGLPDWWETRHGLNPSVSGDAKIFWGMSNTAAYLGGFSRNAAGDALQALPTSGAGGSAAGSSGASSEVIARTVLTAERFKYLTYRGGITRTLAQGDVGPSEDLWRSDETIRHTISHDKESAGGGNGDNDDASVDGFPFEEDDPRDYKLDNEIDNPDDTDGNGDVDDTDDVLVRTYSTYSEDWSPEAIELVPVTPQGDRPDLEPTEGQRHDYHQYSSDTDMAGNPDGSEEAYAGFDPTWATDEITNRNFGISDDRGWMGDGWRGVQSKTGKASWSYSDDPYYWEEGDEYFDTVWESVTMDWKEIRLQTNIAPAPGETIVRTFLIEDELETTTTDPSGETETTVTRTVYGKVALVIDPGNLKANRYVLYPEPGHAAELDEMVAIIAGTAIIHLQPPLDGANTKRKRSALFVSIVPDDNMAGVIGDLVPSVQGPFGERHFVTPRNPHSLDYVYLKANGVTEYQFISGDYQWQGGEEVPGVLRKRKVRRDLAGHYQVYLLKAGSTAPADIMNVWVVWCEWNPVQVVVPPTKGYGEAPQGTFFSFVRQGIVATAVIKPDTIITVEDRPALDGAPQSDPPGTGELHLNDGKPIARPKYKWDISRQYRCKITTNNFQKQWALNFGTGAAVPGGGIYSRIRGPSTTSNIVDYPDNSLAGNDDSQVETTQAGTWGENSNPYDTDPAGFAAKGVLYDSDSPSHPVALNVPPPNGAGLLVKLQFRQLCRLEIGGKWHLISDFQLWKHHGWLVKDPQDRNGDNQISPIEVYEGALTGGADNNDW